MITPMLSDNVKKDIRFHPMSATTIILDMHLDMHLDMGILVFHMIMDTGSILLLRTLIIPILTRPVHMVILMGTTTTPTFRPKGIFQCRVVNTISSGTRKVIIRMILVEPDLKEKMQQGQDTNMMPMPALLERRIQ